MSGFVGSTAAMSEIWFLAAVSYDRFKGIHFTLDTPRTTHTQVPISSLLLSYEYDFYELPMLIHPDIKSYFSFHQARVIIFLTWGFSIVLSICPLIGWSKYVSEVRV